MSTQLGRQRETVRYVGFWARLAAFAIDTLLLLSISMPILLWTYGLSGMMEPVLVRGPVDLLVSWVGPIVATLLFWRYRSATPGKMIIGAVIADAATGSTPSLSQLVVRYFAYLASIAPIMLGFVWIAFDARKQSFHDKLARTVVVYRDSIAVPPSGSEKSSGGTAVGTGGGG
jgi:uncharacterized RDD family membrane protein YckC